MQDTVIAAQQVAHCLTFVCEAIDGAGLVGIATTAKSCWESAMPWLPDDLDLTEYMQAQEMRQRFGLRRIFAAKYLLG